MPKLKQCPYQLIIAIDQLFNVICLGWADETFSARCWRQRNKNKFWALARKIVDILLFWDTKDGMKHCEWAYENEDKRAQCAPEYRN